MAYGYQMFGGGLTYIAAICRRVLDCALKSFGAKLPVILKPRFGLEGLPGQGA
jgi:hypothetical protein